MTIQLSRHVMPGQLQWSLLSNSPAKDGMSCIRPRFSPNGPGFSTSNLSQVAEVNGSNSPPLSIIWSCCFSVEVCDTLRKRLSWHFFLFSDLVNPMVAYETQLLQQPARLVGFLLALWTFQNSRKGTAYRGVPTIWRGTDWDSCQHLQTHSTHKRSPRSDCTNNTNFASALLRLPFTWGGVPRDCGGA